uniref:Uncharacterized protein n=1 Tax=Hyaloperonospora arabidopsidis (strain Emoy2) TaxID=559515 RepID=M4BTE1_HYAAE
MFMDKLARKTICQVWVERSRSNTCVIWMLVAEAAASFPFTIRAIPSIHQVDHLGFKTERSGVDFVRLHALLDMI